MENKNTWESVSQCSDEGGGQISCQLGISKRINIIICGTSDLTIISESSRFVQSWKDKSFDKNTEQNYLQKILRRRTVFENLQRRTNGEEDGAIPWHKKHEPRRDIQG